MDPMMGPGTQRTGDIAQALGMKPTGLTVTRSRLIKKGMIYSPAHGELAFTVPLFDEFMMRVMAQ
jgi:Mn-dependent DtxR family transcriptional regulator